MRKSPSAIGASITLALSLAVGGVAMAQDNTGSAKPPMTDSTKPHIGTGPAEEKSLPSSAPPATTTRTTGATNQDPTVKAMNSNEKKKIEAEGK